VSGPIVFISHHKIKEGKVEEFREAYRQASKTLEAEKPRTVGFLHYLDEDESEVTSIHVVPDAEAMEEHLAGVGGRAGKAAEFLEFGRIEIYGEPSEKAMEAMEKSTSQIGIDLTVKPEFVSGYLRLKEG